MYDLQRARLISDPYFGFNAEEAEAVIARAYGFKTYSNSDESLKDPIPGLHIIHSPAEILSKDPQHQLIEFIRMATNLSLPGLPVVTKGTMPKRLVACMFNFTNFDALVAYAKSEPMDPHSADMAMIEKFERRHGIKAPGQLLFGRSYSNHTYVIRSNVADFQHYIDQEIALTNLTGLQVAVVRANTDADQRLNMMLSDFVVQRGPLQEHQSSIITGARKPDAHVAISIVPDIEYTLEQLVAAHLACLTRDAPAGRALIIDGVALSRDPHAYEAGFKLAALRNINLVIAHDEPDVRLWNKMESRLVFGFDRDLNATDSDELNNVLTQASTFIGRMGSKLLHLYHTTAGGSRYTAYQLSSDTVSSNIVRRIFGKRLA